jgi:hypothetical protein
MSQLSIQQLRGLKDLIQDAVAGGVNITEETHQAIARQPYALLAKIPIIATPAHVVEHVQQTVTGSVYQTIRAVNQVAGALANQVLDHLEESN